MTVLWQTLQAVKQPSCPSEALCAMLTPAADVLLIPQVRVGRAAVTRLRLSADQTSLFTCSADGAVCMLDIQDRELSRGGKQYVLLPCQPACAPRLTCSRLPPRLSRACCLLLVDIIQLLGTAG